MARSEPKKLGILGGTFDPPHIAHLRIAEEVREALKLDKVFFIPAGLPPHKKEKKLTPFEKRLEMTQLAVKSNPNFEVLDIEKNIIPSYTVKTLKKLHSLFSGAELFFIVGLDAFKEIHTWYSYEEIPNYSKLVVVSRAKDTASPAEVNLIAERVFGKSKKGQVLFLPDVTRLDVSSKKIRSLVKFGKSIKYLVPTEVEDYILKNQLYAE